MTQEEVTDELNRMIASGKVDNDGRSVSYAWVRTVTQGKKRSGEDWSFVLGTPEECEVVAHVYAWALASGQPDPWPTVAEADWWVKIVRVLPKGINEKYVFRMGRFAAASDTATQERIAHELMRASVLRPGGSLPSRVERPRDVPQVGGTAIADMYPHSPYQGGAAIPHMERLKP
jgi:hypothetical protein